MTAQNVYIISHSSLDMVLTVKLYEKYKEKCKARILISSTPENLKFLRSINLPERSIKYIHYESRARKYKLRNAWGFIRQLRKEKRILDSIAAEIAYDMNNILYFFSYNSDPQAGYLACLAAKTNPVKLIDVLNIRPIRLTFDKLLSKNGLKNFISVVAYNLVFGNIFILSGTKSSPHISLNFKNSPF